MLNITQHQGNTNQNHNEIPPLTCQNGKNEQLRKQQMLVRMQRKGNVLTLLMGMQTRAASLENSMEGPRKKFKKELPNDPAIALVGI